MRDGGRAGEPLVVLARRKEKPRSGAWAAGCGCGALVLAFGLGLVGWGVAREDAEREPARLRVECDVPARVWLDGQAIGDAPTDHVVAPGPHIVELVARDGRRAIRDVRARDGAEVRVRHDFGPLTPDEGDSAERTDARAVPRAWTITSDTPAEVWLVEDDLDEAPLGNTPFEWIDLARSGDVMIVDGDENARTLTLPTTDRTDVLGHAYVVFATRPPARSDAMRATRPTERDVGRAFGAVMGALRACADGWIGRLDVELAFGPDGHVVSATVASDAPADVLSCAARAASEATVPPFTEPEHRARRAIDVR